MKYFFIVIKEPVTHFVIISLSIFLINNWMSGGQKEVIVITSQVRDYLINTQQEIQLKTLSETETNKVVEAYVREEVFYREAYKRGLDKSDGRMRRNMIRKLTSLLDTKIPTPSEQDLRDFFNNNPEQFIQPAAYTLDQVYFKDSSIVPDNMLETLGQGEDFSPDTYRMAGLVSNFPRIRYWDYSKLLVN